MVLLLAGCASPHGRPEVAARPFEFARDTFAFPNETYWVYLPVPGTGRMEHETRQPPPEFAHRCFVLVRAAKQFHRHARFDATAPRATDDLYRKAIREIVRRSPRRTSEAGERVTIPGYADLRTFSGEHEALLKAEVGPSWQSYAQRGHWRMVFPFSRSHQERAAVELARTVAAGAPAVVHLVRFPALSINHAVLVYAAETRGDRIHFVAYDPNEARAPINLVFDRSRGRFEYPGTPYFRGGQVDVYEVYRSFWY